MNDPVRAMALTAGVLCGLLVASAGARAAALSDADRAFLVSTAQGATYELAVARLALTKSTSHAVRSYAQTMVSDHRSLNGRLHQVARQNGVRLPTAMTDDKQQSLDHLSGLNGKEFDAAFVGAEADDNKNDTATEQKEIDTTDNAQVKALVRQLQAADTKHAAIGQTLQREGQ